MADDIMNLELLPEKFILISLHEIEICFLAIDGAKRTCMAEIIGHREMEVVAVFPFGKPVFAEVFSVQII